MKNLIEDSGISNDKHAKKIHTIYNLAPEITLEKNLHHPKKHKDMVIFASGRLEEYKGFHALLRAFAAVLASSQNNHANPNNKVDSKNNLTLVIAGDGPYSSELKKLSLKLGILHNVKFLGKLPLSRIYRQYVDSDIVI